MKNNDKGSTKKMISVRAFLIWIFITILGSALVGYCVSYNLFHRELLNAVTVSAIQNPFSYPVQMWYLNDIEDGVYVASDENGFAAIDVNLDKDSAVVYISTYLPYFMKNASNVKHEAFKCIIDKKKNIIIEENGIFYLQYNEKDNMLDLVVIDNAYFCDEREQILINRSNLLDRGQFRCISLGDSVNKFVEWQEGQEGRINDLSFYSLVTVIILFVITVIITCLDLFKHSKK